MIGMMYARRKPFLWILLSRVTVTVSPTAAFLVFLTVRVEMPPEGLQRPIGAAPQPLHAFSAWSNTTAMSLSSLITLPVSGIVGFMVQV